MSDARELVEGAFNLLYSKPGYNLRENQLQLALTLCDLIQSGSPGAIEAPTGIGKSLACLIPAIALAQQGKKVVIATYTNVLAEQYWNKDLPFAMSLFEKPLIPAPCFLIGRQRYCCLTSLREATNGHSAVCSTPFDAPRRMVAEAEMGLEREFSSVFSKAGLKAKQVQSLWNHAVAPPACPGRACPDYDACFYYRAREAALSSGLIITNHSVVIQHCLMKASEDGDDGPETNGLLGDPDYIILDEAHDFARAAMSGLEFVLDQRRLQLVKSLAGRIEHQLSQTVQKAKQKKAGSDAASAAEKSDQLSSSTNGAIPSLMAESHKRIEGLDRAVDSAATGLASLALMVDQDKVLATNPSEWQDQPALRNRVDPSVSAQAETILDSMAKGTAGYGSQLDRHLSELVLQGEISDSVKNQFLQSTLTQRLMIQEIGVQARAIAHPRSGGLGWVTTEQSYTQPLTAALRSDVIDLGPCLTDLLWEKVPCAAISATIATDSTFEFFRSLVGFRSDFEDILPSPFHYPEQATIYLPKEGTIPDPSTSRGAGQTEYYGKLAREIEAIIVAMGGRTLVLFHSRKEMEEVHRLIRLPDHLPVLIQGRGSGTLVGDSFKDKVAASLFALRSFWTGFDAPGETLSCVVIVRIPFEVPVVPTQIARMVMLGLEGKDPFAQHTLNQAKIMIRQGAGRLIRKETDCGLICLLDPRIVTKPYGESILANLPPGMKHIAAPSDWFSGV